ncbi:MAG TPA: YafY family protein [Rectinemataceae bacterium]|nr:YafY family protein [Rectinemataceae bacterium]
MKLDRLLSIVILLLNHESMNAAELARRFEVSVRTIYRDLDAVNAAGIPVVASPGPGGGFGIDPSYTIDRRLLGFDDLRAIIAALKGVNTGLEDRSIASALEKITSLAPRGRAAEFLEDRVVIDLFPWGARKEERRLVRLLEPAIAERRLVSFTYSSYGRKREKRLVEPMTLVFKAYAWYLWAWCRLRGGYRLFKLSRIRDLELRLDRFKRRAEPYPRETELEPPALQELSLRFDPACAAQAEEWFGGEEGEREAGGGLRLRLSLPAGDWIVRTLLGFGPGLEVLAPESLRLDLARAAQAIAAANDRPNRD